MNSFKQKEVSFSEGEILNYIISKKEKIENINNNIYFTPSEKRDMIWEISEDVGYYNIVDYLRGGMSQCVNYGDGVKSKEYLDMKNTFGKMMEFRRYCLDQLSKFLK